MQVQSLFAQARLGRVAVGPAIKLQVNIPDGLWSPLADASQLENAILNLCLNARDAMPEGGRIDISMSNLPADVTSAQALGVSPGCYVEIMVRDSGVGMPPDVAAKAFEPFFTTKPIGKGTGLGLSMIYGFARQSGGQTRIESESGRGTSVTIYLPASVEGAPDASPVSGQRRAVDVHGASVLVVDDDPTVRELVADALREAGFQVSEVADGAEALRALSTLAVLDLLLTDVGLPGGMNGHQLADAVRKVRPELHVLFMTGYAEGVSLGSSGLGAKMEIMIKPFELADLVARATEMVTR